MDNLPKPLPENMTLRAIRRAINDIAKGRSKRIIDGSHLLTVAYGESKGCNNYWAAKDQYNKLVKSQGTTWPDAIPLVDQLVNKLGPNWPLSSGQKGRGSQRTQGSAQHRKCDQGSTSSTGETFYRTTPRSGNRAYGTAKPSRNPALGEATLPDGKSLGIGAKTGAVSGSTEGGGSTARVPSGESDKPCAHTHCDCHAPLPPQPEMFRELEHRSQKIHAPIPRKKGKEGKQEEQKDPGWGPLKSPYIPKAGNYGRVGDYHIMQPRVVGLTNSHRKMMHLLRRLFDFGLGRQSARWDGEAIVKELVTKRMRIQQCRREELDHPTIILAPDMSGSCAHINGFLTEACEALSAMDPRILTIQHGGGNSEGYPHVLIGKLAIKAAQILDNTATPNLPWGRLIELLDAKYILFMGDDHGHEGIINCGSHSPKQVIWVNATDGCVPSKESVERLGKLYFEDVARSFPWHNFSMHELADTQKLGEAIIQALDRCLQRAVLERPS